MYPENSNLITINGDTENRAAEAIELFCYHTKKWIGSFAAALEGFDIVVFLCGIGENSPEAQSKICEGLNSLELNWTK